ncbi:MAG: EAL domain-containing protein [Oscillospiraceae bacterium]|nr:EAL domain-containing protein [Oscillospiraceae bacterium]
MQDKMTSMQYKLMLLHQFLNEITGTANEDDLKRLAESYKNKLSEEPEEDVIYKLWEDAMMLGRELISLKTSGEDAVRSRRLAALTAEERKELAETEKIIDENRFSYHFQPIVNTVDGSIYSYEALMRPVNDMGLTPFHILKYAGLTGRLNDIERATFLNVLNIIDKNEGKFGDRRVFINSIPKTKLESADLISVGELLVKHSDTAVVELTEQDEFSENELNALKERYMNMGIKIAIDDYGTGYSNVANLLRYMPNYVKIDRSLLSDIQNSPKKRHFVREIIGFCHNNGIMALAEGVETTDELRTVILLGADLIQGYYTARPSAEIVDSIPYEIRQEIKFYAQERQDGKDQQIYAADGTEHILLERLVKDGYECILIGTDQTENSEVTIIGSPTLDTDIHIEFAKGFSGRVMLENVHLSNVKNRPCIDLAENSNVTLILKGENKLIKSGIRVPENARLRFEGEGDINIDVDATEYFGIGNDISSMHGELIFDQSGAVNITTNGKMGAAIGSGLGGSTTIRQGKYVIAMNGDTGVGIGSLYADSKLEIDSCDFNADIALAKGVAIGSISSNADIQISRSSAKLYMSGAEMAAIGTIGGESANVYIHDGIVIINIRAPRCTCAGALDESSDIRIENAAFRVTAGGQRSLPFGGFSGNTKVSLTDADTTVKLETHFADIGKYVSADKIKVTDGRTVFTNLGEELLLKD